MDKALNQHVDGINDSDNGADAVEKDIDWWHRPHGIASSPSSPPALVGPPSQAGCPLRGLRPSGGGGDYAIICHNMASFMMLMQMFIIIVIWQSQSEGRPLLFIYCWLC